MIAKFDGISGDNLAALLTYIHGDENRVAIPQLEDRLMIIRVKAVNPVNQGDDTRYGLTLDIIEWVPKRDTSGQYRVDPKFLLKVYEILGQDRATEGVSSGIRVKTTQPNLLYRHMWNDTAWEKRKWGVHGTAAVNYDSRGQCYVVQHEDGTVATYDASEIEIIS
ncbi:hypothetical protein IPH92_02775 [Candidatus Kaiserbacteria bacterium]|nr:MAG: hypothetical protein IPH92_02775 [Candidatus Kaiserbacteria bacterium]